MQVSSINGEGVKMTKEEGNVWYSNGQMYETLKLFCMEEQEVVRKTKNQ